MTVPFSSNAGFKPASASIVVSSRMQPSLTTFSLPASIATISSVNLPAWRAAVASRCERDGELLLLLARDLVFLRDVLGGLAHRHVGALHLVRERRVRHRVEAHHRHPRHRFDAGADERLPGIHRDRARRQVDRLHRRPAEAVDRRAGHRLRQPRDHGDQARDIEALLALRERAAEHQVLDVLRLRRRSSRAGPSPPPPPSRRAAPWSARPCPRSGRGNGRSRRSPPCS